MTFSRREFLRQFLRGAGCFTAVAAGPFAPLVRPAIGAEPVRFPEGIASADPQPDAVLLWTRAVPSDEEAAVDLTVQVATDPSFTEVVLEAPARAARDADHTVRFFAQGLAPDTIHYYRFVADGGRSETGRTWTAPRPDADREIRLAWASCQGMEWGFFGGWRRMIVDDEMAPSGHRIDFVLHVGDFIYEEGGMVVSDEDHAAVHGDNRFLRDADGRDRTPLPFPSGGRSAHYGERAAATLEDYRHLYKAYLADPNLRAARARWPFVCTWDDHEFVNNCWQSHGTEKAFQTGRAAATRAWFEYVPAVLSRSTDLGGVASRAHDHRPVTVGDTPFGDPGEPAPEEEPNNLAAIGSITLYRSLRFGKNVDLFVTDTRSYRSDHCVPEVWVEEHFDGRLLKTPELIATLDAGQTAAGGSPPAEITIGEVTAPNPRKGRAPGSLLGATQRAWLEESLTASTATWKLWANSVPAMTITLDFDTIPFAGAPRILLTDDAWAGYPSELRGILEYVRQQDVQNVVSLAGDVHMNLAGSVAPDPFGSDTEPVLPEFVVAGIASASTFRIIRALAPSLEGLAVAVIDEDDPSLELYNNTLKNGVFSSIVYANTGSKLLSELVGSSDTNPHLTWIDANAVGYGVLRASTERCDVELVTIETPLRDLGTEPSPVLRRVRFRLAPGEKTPNPIELEGTPPFPISSI